MIYLSENDIHSHIQIRLKDESQSDFTTAINELELQNIELVKSYMIGRYDTFLIFDSENGAVKNAVLIKILSFLVIYDLVRRNAARKVPSDYKEDYKWAIEQLERINSGRLILEGLPKPTDASGHIESTSIWGNNTNENFYL